MRVGILTFHRAMNYGALLQAFALKSAIASKGAKADIIDYRNDYIENLYTYRGFLSQRGKRAKVRYLFQCHAEKRKRKRFEAFRRDYLGLNGETYYTKDTICDANKQYDRFVTGSDQVWNPEMHKLDSTYYLNFVSEPAKKRSYAASFGVEQIREEYLPLYHKWLAGFPYYSVREQAGCAILSGLSDKSARVDIDPVFLLTSEEWKRALGIREHKEKYVFIFGYGLTENQKKMARICHQAGMKIYYVAKKQKSPFGVPCRFLTDLGPKEFAEYLSGASFVITNSFHGTALSIVFHVPFAMEYLGGSLSPVNSRLENILSLVGLQDRVLTEETVGEVLLSRAINWDSVEKILDERREDSYAYIERGIL